MKCANGFPCALVLDCYPAHRTQAVKDLARQLNIELIFVPANGIGNYQPLDRKLFGIVKSSLRYMAKARIFTGKDRFEIIGQHLVKAWTEITSEALDSAWNITGLQSAIEKVQNGEEEDVVESAEDEHMDEEEAQRETTGADELDFPEENEREFWMMITKYKLLYSFVFVFFCLWSDSD